MADLASWPKRLLNTGHMTALAAVERRVPYWSLDRIHRRQSRRVQSIVRHAYESVPYYRRTMDELGLQPDDFRTAADLTKLPLLDDVLVRQQPDLFDSTRYGENDRRALRTTGTTSYVRKRIYWDEAALMRRLPIAERGRVVLYRLAEQRWRRRELYIFPPGSVVRNTIGLLAGQTWVSSRIMQRQYFSPDDPLEDLVATLNTFRPHIVFSFGSFADHFFRYLTDNGITAAMPRVWQYNGDVFPPETKRLAEETFGCFVHSSYASVETGRIGFQCERREGFHLDIDVVAVRVVDESGRDVPDGEDGEIVISNLYNRATVLLNHRLGDRGALATEPCPCGRTLPLLERLQGRQSELIVLADGRVLPGLVVSAMFPHQLASAFKAQIVHPAAGHIRWRIVPFAGVDQEEMRRAILARGREVFGEDAIVEVEFVADIPPRPGGKFARVVTSDNAHDGPRGG